MFKKTVAKLGLVYSVPILLATQPIAQAATVPVGASPSSHTSLLSNIVNSPRTPVNLNLSSTSPSVRAPNSRPVTIEVGRWLRVGSRAGL